MAFNLAVSPTTDKRGASAAAVAGAYGSFVIANAWLDASGVVASVCCALIVGQRHEDSIGEFSSTLASIASVVLVLLAGSTVTTQMFEDRWLAMLIGVVAVTVARITIVWPTLMIDRLVHPNHDRDNRESAIFVLGSSRGVVTLALALSLPLELTGWYTVQAIAYGVVLFGLWIQVPTMLALLARWFDFDR